MAIAKHDNFQGLHGKLGNFVVYDRLGTLCVRRRPEGFKPTGAGQVAQQRRMASANTFYKAARAAGVASYWNAAVKPAGWTGYNLFIHENIRAFSAEGLLEAPEKVRLTVKTGPELPDGLVLEQEAAGKAVVRWKNVTNYPGCAAEDRLVVAVMRGGRYFDLRYPSGRAGIAYRRDERVEIVLPAPLQAYRHVYVFMLSKDGSKVSNSIYMGNIIW